MTEFAGSPPEADGAPVQRRYWLHLLLFGLTVVTTTAIGARLAYDFANNQPPLAEDDIAAFQRLFREPGLWMAGLPYSMTLLAILLAHEFGHYFACVYYRVHASLPYFLPFPVPIGTLGAFIRIRPPIYSRRALFDIGIAGPLAGFVFAVPALAIGIAESKILPGIAYEGDLIFGAPILERLFEALVFPGVRASDVFLHPVARAAWVGVLATALNLLPIGQLDGGHILYALVGRWHRILSRLSIAALIPLGMIYSRSWLVWAALIFFFGMRYIPIHDEAPVGRGRRLLALVALAIFVLSFTVTPIRLGS